MLALKVTANFEPKIKDGKIKVEEIQDSVEEVLSLSLIHISMKERSFRCGSISPVVFLKGRSMW